MATLSDDIIRDIILRIQQLAPGFEESMAIELEREIRADWAGEKPYIAADPDREARRVAAQTQLARGRPVAEVASKTGLTRGGLYKLLKRNQ